jgi:ABC-type uncharacterized transport system auxiliary subunit
MKKHFALLCLFALAGCGALKSAEPQQVMYSLRPVAATESPAIGERVVLEIVKPTVPPGFDRDRIALYLNGGNRLDYFASARWSSTLDELIQTVTARTAANLYPNVVANASEQNVSAQYRLQLKINEFQPIYEAAATSNPRLISNIEFTLISLPDEKILTSFVMGREGTASSNRLETITLGLEKMLQEIERDAFSRLEPWLKAPIL